MIEALPLGEKILLKGKKAGNLSSFWSERPADFCGTKRRATVVPAINFNELGVFLSPFLF